MQVKDCFEVRPGVGVRGETIVPGDKSISHRAVFFGALANGTTRVRGWLPAGDTEASLGAARALGINIDRHSPTELTIYGGQLRPPAAALDLVNAGTGIRLLTGIMAGQSFQSVLDGSEQLRRRPMNRIITPLKMMGADIEGVNGYAPLTVRPAKLRGIHYHMPMASAQVKSAILLAGLFAEGETSVTQPGPARDHTERMLKAMGVDLQDDGETVTLKPISRLNPMDFTVPGDLSSAAFLIVAALILPDSDITLTGVSLNPTRTGILEALKTMGADLTVTETGLEAGDPVGTIQARTSQLKGTRIGGELVVRMIDEFPIFMVASLFAEGETYVRDAGELRVKETDRLSVMTEELSKLGAKINEMEDGYYVYGRQSLKGATAFGHDDHRISMALVVAGLAAHGDSTVMDAECASDSFPGYAETLRRLGADVHVKLLEHE
jgi:3-phosphoshikimate 1-carboxyvinyltransferase